MRWISVLVSGLFVALLSYFWAIPLCGTWLGLTYLPPEKQSLLTTELLLLTIGSSVLTSLIPRVKTMFTLMWGGPGIGAIIVLTLALNVTSQPLPPAYMRVGGMVGAFIGFTLTVGSALTTIVIKVFLEWRLIPRLTAKQKVETGVLPRRPACETRAARTSPLFKLAIVLVAGIVLLPLMKKVVLPKFGTPAPNTTYRLTPSVWKGNITFKGESHPFTLVFEQIDADGRLLGYMDWPDDFRLLVEGTATGNHLIFEDTEFILGNAAGGLYDKKDVWITGDRMVGTDKNGTATLQARLTSSSPPPSDAKTAVGHRTHKKMFAATWNKRIRVCEDVQTVDQTRLGPACWKELAKQAKDLRLCGRTTELRDRLTCHIDVVWQTGEWKGCRDLGYSMQIMECTEAAVAKGGDIKACEVHAGTGNHGSYAVCQAVAKRDPDACAKLPPDPQNWYQSRCWSLLAIALKEPQWCDQLPQGFNSECRSTVEARLEDDTSGDIRSDDLDRCDHINYSLDADACYLKLVGRGAEANLCSRIRNDKLQDTCKAVVAL